MRSPTLPRANPNNMLFLLIMLEDIKKRDYSRSEDNTLMERMQYGADTPEWLAFSFFFTF